jgi:hypothetical protein
VNDKGRIIVRKAQELKHCLSRLEHIQVEIIKEEIIEAQTEYIALWYDV